MLSRSLEWQNLAEQRCANYAAVFAKSEAIFLGVIFSALGMLISRGLREVRATIQATIWKPARNTSNEPTSCATVWEVCTQISHPLRHFTPETAQYCCGLDLRGVFECVPGCDTRDPASWQSLEALGYCTQTHFFAFFCGLLRGKCAFLPNCSTKCVICYVHIFAQVSRLEAGLGGGGLGKGTLEAV